MSLDVPTLVFILSLILACQVLALGLQFHLSRTCPGVRWWLLGTASIALGFILMPIARSYPVKLLINLDNPLIILGHILLYAGVLDFTGRKERKRWLWAAYAVFLGLYQINLHLRHDRVGMGLTIWTTLTLFTLLTAHRLAADPATRSGASIFTSLPFAGTGVFLASQLAATLASRQVPPFGGLPPAAFVVPIVTSTLWTYGFILMVNQRTEAERLRALVRERQLQKARSLGRLAGSVAHLLNNRLQAVQSSLDLIHELPPGVDPAREVARAREATARAAEIGTQMLASLGQLPREERPCRLTGLVRDHLESCRADLPTFVRLEMDLPEPGPLVFADPGGLHRMFAHLLDNAREALGQAPGWIRVRVGAGPAGELPAVHRFPVAWQPRAAAYAHLEVSDSGPGIPVEDLDNLFDPFFSTRFPGRGLGLSLVLGYVQAHGGAVSVASRPGYGSTFRIHLPLRPLHEPIQA
jgi:signal transduction histidine kinase